jgi:hypothetical protein
VILRWSLHTLFYISLLTKERETRERVGCDGTLCRHRQAGAANVIGFVSVLTQVLLPIYISTAVYISFWFFKPVKETYHIGKSFKNKRRKSHFLHLIFSFFLAQFIPQLCTFWLWLGFSAFGILEKKSPRLNTNQVGFFFFILLLALLHHFFFFLF